MSDKSYGSGYVRAVADGEENPFWTLEALQEHVQMLWGILAKQGVEIWENGKRGGERPKGEVGTAVYHLRAVDDYSKKLFEGFAALEHVLYRASDDNVNPAEQDALKQDLEQRARKYEEYWKSIV